MIHPEETGHDNKRAEKAQNTLNNLPRKEWY
uniref:Uncharacterized protein n=1 Tax=Rhizophora mucronata TaxID=61149 RepID=A0A2P2P0W1_RHIMU